MLIVKTYEFKSLSEAVFVHIKALCRSQKEVAGFVYSLIESPNLSEIQKVLKRDSRFKAFAIKCVQDIVKDEMSIVVSNPKLSMSHSKISLNAIEGFSISTINNKHVRSAPILRFILSASVDNIGVLSHSCHWGIENPDANNESNESEIEMRIELKDEINRDKLIRQTKTANSQHRRDLVPMVALYMLSYTRSQRSNIYQMIKGYFIFVYNVAKRYIDVLYSMGLCVLYKTIQVALKENIKEVEWKIQDKV